MEVQVQVAKETYELGMGVVKIIEAVQVALKDGYQPGQDIPAIIMASFGALTEAMQGYEKIAVEAKSGEAFNNAVLLTVGNVFAKLK